jgi:5-methylcytosine-specific restriction endonuclease McrA
VEKMGTAESDVLEFAVEETFSGLNLRSLRICDTIRLLNSTSLGNVISDRQLYRHRKRSGGEFMAGPRRIDFFRYMAWIREQLAERRKRQRDRPAHLKRIDKRPAISVTVNNILALLERQSYKCALSGRELTPKTSSLDHILPVSRDGDSSIDNAQVLDAAVNRAKNTMTNDEFVAMCRQVVRHADR